MICEMTFDMIVRKKQIVCTVIKQSLVDSFLLEKRWTCALITQMLMMRSIAAAILQITKMSNGRVTAYSFKFSMKTTMAATSRMM